MAKGIQDDFFVGALLAAPAFFSQTRSFAAPAAAPEVETSGY